MPMHVAYVSYADQSGVTPQVTQHLKSSGHHVSAVRPLGPVEFRAPWGARCLTYPNVRNLISAFRQFRLDALAYRWNTAFAFDLHSAEARRLIGELPMSPDVILQNGALFSPGAGSREPGAGSREPGAGSREPGAGSREERNSAPYVLYCDHTRRLAMEQPVYPNAGLAAPPDYGRDWYDREKNAYLHAAAVLTFSKRTALSVINDYGVRSDRVHVVGAGANVFPEDALRQDNGNTVAFIGKDFERKGGRVLLHAFAGLRQIRPNASLLIAGPERGPSTPGVEWLGEISIAEVPAVLSRATVFCMPTLREPFGIAFLDALACGVPCVGTRLEAIPEIIEEGVTGLLVPPDDSAALTRALNLLLSDREQARKMGQTGREAVRAHCRWQHVTERIERVLFDVSRRAPHLASATTNG